MEPINVLDKELKKRDKAYEAFEDPDGDLFISYHKDDYHALIAVTLGGRIYLHPLNGDYSWLAILIKTYLDDSAKEMTMYVN